ncbi:GntR family transcriptional regulator [Mycolicibacterium sarraceniae]|uniref:Phosphonate metabolism transcriptional regulator PhnF n=1 Tax=Mycolicibacterium sarraceniae TaxID=1534348 RepID=A0A7I7SMY2_9MYCO|nr:GntR family transcriptional regulator [Mycolicibacterium sarraceniae]BBY58312.1 phosphonate metabolism transcriptional regulator PhnF [Mycolicibacterium sarraceniae]
MTDAAGSQRPAPRAGTPGRTLRYQHVYDLVVSLIEHEGLREGDQLPSTAELAEMAGVSVISVRRALDELTHNGKITRHQGVGIFVAPQRMLSEPSRPGALLETFKGQGENVQDEVQLDTELVSMVVGLPNGKHATALSIDAGQPVWEICRVRRMGGVPKVLETAVLPLTLVPALDEQRLAAGESLYGYLAERYGFTDEFVEQVFEVDQPNSLERNHLRLSSKDHVVRIRGVSVDAAGVAFDSFQQTYPAREFVFYISGASGRRLMEPDPSGSWSVRPLGRTAAPQR